MNHLPIEILTKIFSYLNLIDNLNCKQVCKSFLLAVEDRRLKTLFIFEDGLPFKRNFMIYEYFKRQNSINKCEIPKFLIQFENDKLFSKLEHFCLFSKAKFINPIKLLNKFNCLKSLEILSNLEFDQNEESRILNLSELRSLSINLDKSKPIILNTNKLEILSVNSFKNIELIYPETIRYLFITFYCRKFDTNLEKITNLEYLNIDYFLNALSEKVFSKLNKLIKIDTASNCILYLNELKKKYNRINLIIFSYGIEYSKSLINPICELSSCFRSKNIETFSNCKIADKFYFIKSIQYDERLGDINDDLLNRFINIKCIIAGSILKKNEKINEDKFIKFMTRFQHLSILDLKLNKLSQNFFNQLPSILPHLLDFRFDYENDLNLEFVLKFEYLKKLNAIYFIPLNFIDLVFGKLKNLNDFSFFYKDKKENENSVTILIDNMNKIKLIYKSHLMTFNNLEEFKFYLNEKFLNL